MSDPTEFNTKFVCGGAGDNLNVKIGKKRKERKQKEKTKREKAKKSCTCK